VSVIALLSRRLLRAEFLRDASQRGDWNDDRLREPSGVRQPWDLQRRAVDRIALTARDTAPAVASEPSDRDTLADLEPDNTVADRVDPPGDLVPGHHRKGHTRHVSVD
jgi:hypothetical protein